MQKNVLRAESILLIPFSYLASKCQTSILPAIDGTTFFLASQ
jgi:hypothetical protein